MFDSLEHAAIIAGIGDDGHGLEVLGGASNHRRSSDVDLFDGLFQGDLARGSILKRIKVHDNKVDWEDTMRPGLRLVFFVPAQKKQAPMNLGMQGLDASAKNFGKSREA